MFFLLSAGISWAFEQVGVAMGLVYGAYHYGDMLGPKLGHVPFMIPIAWFMMLYPSYIIANLIASGSFDPRPRTPVPTIHHDPIQSSFHPTPVPGTGPN